MVHPLLECVFLDQQPEAYLRSVGVVFAEFGNLTQDSGNVSYGVQIDIERYFVKTAGSPEDSRPFLDHSARIALLRNAARLHASFRHPALPRLQRVIESPSGPLLVYPWIDGELLGAPREKRDDPQSAFRRFRNLPASTIMRGLDAVFDMHNEAAGAGWIAVDF